MKDIFLNNLNKIINRYLTLDPESKTQLQKLDGKTITIELIPIQFTFQMLFTAEGVELMSGDALAAEAKISGTPIGLTRAMFDKKNRQHFFVADLQIDGDAAFAHQVIALFDELEIDWEEHLSHFVGDIPAHHLHRAAQKIKSILKYTDDSMTQNVSDYVHEEKNWFPVREALDDFFSDIDNLRLDVDRLDARMQQLELQVNEECSEIN